MAQELQLFGAFEAPEYLKQTATAKALLSLGDGMSFNRITMDGSFKIYTGKEVEVTGETELEVVVVYVDSNEYEGHAGSSRAFYEGGYVEGGGKNAPPVCTSFFGIKPDDDIEKPQHATCAGCPRTIKKADGYKDCKVILRTVVILRRDLDKPNPPLYRYDISATAAWKKYGADEIFSKKLPIPKMCFTQYNQFLKKNAGGITASAVVTVLMKDLTGGNNRVCFMPLVENRAPVFLTQDQAEMTDSLFASEEMKLLTTYQGRAKPKDDAEEYVEPELKAKETAKPTAKETVAEKPKAAPAKKTPPPKKEPARVLRADIVAAMSKFPEDVQEWINDVDNTPEEVAAYIDAEYPEFLEPVEVPKKKAPPKKAAPVAEAASEAIGDIPDFSESLLKDVDMMDDEHLDGGADAFA